MSLFRRFAGMVEWRFANKAYERVTSSRFKKYGMRTFPSSIKAHIANTLLHEWERTTPTM
jgi:hypothetical protein